MTGTRKPAWVLLRGLLRERRHWGSFPETLKQRLGDCDVICPDIPGNGSRARETSPCSIEAMMEALRRDLAGRGTDHPVNLLALSMGGMIAAAWLRHYPEEIASAVLINTSMRPYAPFYRRLKPEALTKLLRGFSRGLVSREKAILELTANHAAGNAALLADWLKYARENPVRPANAFRQLCAAARFTGPADPGTAPILLLASRRDRLVDMRCSTALAEAWSCPLVLHCHAGHDLPLDDPEWVADEVARFHRLHEGGSASGSE